MGDASITSIDSYSIDEYEGHNYEELYINATHLLYLTEVNI